MSLDYNSLNEVEKRYVFAVVPQLDDLDSTQLNNLAILCDKIDQTNNILTGDGKDPLAIRNGYLSPSQIYESNSTLDNAHILCSAIDVDDFDGSLFSYLVNNNILDVVDIYAANNSYTPGYIHLQINTPPGGMRVFTP